MIFKIKLKGIEKVIRRLNKEIAGIQGRTQEGMRAVGIFVKGEAQEITPVEKSDLINSAFSDPGNNVEGPVVRVGFEADHAPDAHELPATANFTKPGTGNKFLQKAVDNNHDQIVEIIKNRAKV